MARYIWTSPDATEWERHLYSTLDLIDWTENLFEHFAEGCEHNRRIRGEIPPIETKKPSKRGAKK